MTDVIVSYRAVF